jgi:mRNA-degrading endonuclease toxin of MazEF toxin-antitoxin module
MSARICTGHFLTSFLSRSDVNVSQLATVDTEQLVERLGTLGAGFMRQVDSGLSLVLGL